MLPSSQSQLREIPPDPLEFRVQNEVEAWSRQPLLPSAWCRVGACDICRLTGSEEQINE